MLFNMLSIVKHCNFSPILSAKACESHTSALLIRKHLWYIPCTSEVRGIGSYNFCDHGIVVGIMTPASKH